MSKLHSRFNNKHLVACNGIRKFYIKDMLKVLFKEPISILTPIEPVLRLILPLNLSPYITPLIPSYSYALTGTELSKFMTSIFDTCRFVQKSNCCPLLDLGKTDFPDTNDLLGLDRFLIHKYPVILVTHHFEYLLSRQQIKNSLLHDS